MKLQAEQLRMNEESEKFFNNAFWKKLNGVVNALDNVKARIYIDRKCRFYSLPLFEAGT